jgi:hypothetical protein
LYNKGWIIPDSHINWTHYIFYGADIRIQRLDYIRDQLKILAKEIFEIDGETIDYISGIFHLQHEEGTEIYVLKMSEGKFYETDVDLS